MTGRRRTPPCLALLVLFLAGALSTQRAPGFDTLGMSWRTGRINYRINPNFPDESRTGTRAQQLELLTCSADCWREQSAADLRFV